jgi:hypothetical protein
MVTQRFDRSPVARLTMIAFGAVASSQHDSVGHNRSGTMRHA